MENSQISKKALWTGRVMRWIVILFMLLDGVLKFAKPAMVVETTAKLGYDEQYLPLIGAVVLIGTILYAIPRVWILGAILLTALLGAAVATHIRAGNPLFSHILFPVYIAVLMWLGGWLSDEKLRSVFPVRK